MQREHGAAGKQELDGLWLKAETFERDTQGRLRAASRMNGDCCEEKKHGQG